MEVRAGLSPEFLKTFRKEIIRGGLLLKRD